MSLQSSSYLWHEIPGMFQRLIAHCFHSLIANRTHTCVSVQNIFPPSRIVTPAWYGTLSKSAWETTMVFRTQHTETPPVCDSLSAGVAVMAPKTVGSYPTQVLSAWKISSPLTHGKLPRGGLCCSAVGFRLSFGISNRDSEKSLLCTQPPKGNSGDLLIWSS